MDEVLGALNERQREAVLHDGGALVLAGAGTGKTRVLTGRVARLILRDNAPQASVLAVTFTNKAAKEMRGRVEQMLTGVSARGLTIGTFHSVCHHILRRHISVAGLGLDRNFQIMDMSDQKAFIRRLYKEREISEGAFPIKGVQGYISKHKEAGRRAADAIAVADDVLARATDTYERGVAAFNRKRADVYAIYEEACRRDNKADFDELMLGCVELLRGNARLREHYGDRFRHILIDEFQDTNHLQFEWLKLLDNGTNRFFAVGDDDQSIYSFRGARPENMRDFQVELRANNIIRLEKNYRSTAKILKAANVLINNNINRLGKNLAPTGDEGDFVLWHRAEDDVAEAGEVVARIMRAKDGGACADDIAVLYRTNAQSRAIEQKMVECGIKYRMYGGTRFYDRTEVKHALAYMRLVAASDSDATMRILNFPPRGIGAKSLAQLQVSAQKVGWENAINDSNNRKVRSFAALLSELRASREKLPLGEFARAVVESTGLIKHYTEQKDEEERERAENLREFVTAATQFENANLGNEEDDLLMMFLANVALESGEADSNVTGEAVNLMTVHSAKGLEFDAVMIVGLEEDLLPHKRVFELRPDEQGPAIEEERRLTYVAVTRARKWLSLHYAQMRMYYGKYVMNPPSRFLDELEKSEALQQLKPPVTPKSPNEPKPPEQPATRKTAEDFAVAARARRQMAASEAAQVDSRRKTSPEQTGGLRPGMSVRHDRYGLGVVMSLTGEGREREVAVAFKSVGTKNFKTALAKLQVVS